MLNIDALPTLGVGASLSLSSSPDPVKLVQASGGPAFVEYAGLVDVERVIEEVGRIHATGAQVLYHPSYINFCGSFPNSDAWLRTTAKHIEAVKSAWFAQDLAYCFWQEGQNYSTQMGYFIPPIFNKNSLQLAIERVKEVQAIVPVPVAIEPPPMSFIVGTIGLFDFFGRIAEAVDCAILLDMGHLVSYEMASGQSIKQQLAMLPGERVIEVHIAGGRIKQTTSGPVYVDAHECEIVSETWRMFETMLPALPNVKAVCYECENVNEHVVFDNLKRIRKLVREHSSSETLLQTLDTLQ